MKILKNNENLKKSRKITKNLGKSQKIFVGWEKGWGLFTNIVVHITNEICRRGSATWGGQWQSLHNMRPIMPKRCLKIRRLESWADYKKIRNKECVQQPHGQWLKYVNAEFGPLLSNRSIFRVGNIRLKKLFRYWLFFVIQSQP
jgi:hypothetical protein